MFQTDAMLPWRTVLANVAAGPLWHKIPDAMAKARARDWIELLTLWSGTDAAVIFVTHDLEEAMTLADRVVVMTASPARIKDVFDMDLPRPRNVEEIRMTPEFIGIYRRVWSSLSSEVDIARKAGSAGVA